MLIWHEPGGLFGHPGGASTQHAIPNVNELNPKPHRPIPNTDDIRLPAWCERSALEAWVRRWTDRGYDLRNMEFVGRHARALAKGIKAAIAMQQRLIEHEGWPIAG